MPRKTDGEKIDDLEKLVATLNERVDALRDVIETCVTNQSKTADGHTDLKVKLASLEQSTVEIKSWKQQLGDTEIKTAVAILKSK